MSQKSDEKKRRKAEKQAQVRTNDAYTAWIYDENAFMELLFGSEDYEFDYSKTHHMFQEYLRNKGFGKLLFLVISKGTPTEKPPMNERDALQYIFANAADKGGNVVFAWSITNQVLVTENMSFSPDYRTTVDTIPGDDQNVIINSKRIAHPNPLH